MRWLLVLAITIAAARSARAEGPGQPRPVGSSLGGDDFEAVREVTPQRRALAIAAAVVPGSVVHGIGSWIVHERRPAKQLLYAELLGVAGIVVGGGLVGGSGGNPYTIWPGVPILLAGSGLFFTSWATDVWVAAGGARLDGGPRELEPWSVEAGMTWQHDAYRNRALLRAGGRFELGRVGVGAIGLLDAGGATRLGAADVRVRIFDNWLFARVGGRAHRDDEDELTKLVGEVEVIARLDLERVDAAFAPSFIEGSTGLGVTRVTYADMETDIASELLGRFGWGVYLGRRGEAMAFYDHRRDTLVGGLPAFRASGFVGSVGAMADVRVWGPWAVRAELGVGNAWVTTLAIAYRGGAQ